MPAKKNPYPSLRNAIKGGDQLVVLHSLQLEVAERLTGIDSERDWASVARLLSQVTSDIIEYEGSASKQKKTHHTSPLDQAVKAHNPQLRAVGE